MKGTTQAELPQLPGDMTGEPTLEKKTGQGREAEEKEPFVAPDSVAALTNSNF